MESGLRFAVLGPVRAWRGDAEVELGAPQQRALLAILLLAEGRQVTVDRLIDGLWEQDLPQAAVGTVRTYVSRLRRSLALPGPGGGLIATAGAGYLITGGAADLDLDRFQRLAKDARAAAAGGGPARGAALLREALGLARGVPLAGIPGPYAEAQRARIGELLTAATEERLALEIAAGAHAPAVPELQALLGLHPMREKLAELLMLALYRSGRQADALAVYDHTRRRLAADLGIDPGPAIRDMHQRILRNDTALTAPAAPAGPPPAAARPAQLPAGLTTFTGRDRELARLEAALADPAPAGPVITAGHIRPHGADRRVRQVLLPQAVDQPVDRDLASLGQQRWPEGAGDLFDRDRGCGAVLLGACHRPVPGRKNPSLSRTATPMRLVPITSIVRSHRSFSGTSFNL
jgi:DNA-binding SARP family transcriptional activator